MTDGPRPPVRPNRFDAIASQVNQQRRWYDRKDSKHLRFTAGARVHLHRTFGKDRIKETKAKDAAEVAQRRENAAKEIYAAIADDFGPDAAEAIFLSVTGDGFVPRASASLTLQEFDQIAEQVAIVRGRSGAIVNGVPQETGFGPSFNQELANTLNTSFAPRPAPTNKTPNDALPQALFSPLMLQDMGQATYWVQDHLVSSPDGESGFPRIKDQDWQATNGAILAAKLMNLDQVRTEDFSTLSAFLHRGLFDVLQGLAEDPDKPAAPGLAFTPQNDPRGLNIRCTPDLWEPGRYHFNATLTAPLAEVASADDPGERDRLDPNRSFLRMEIEGFIDCNSPDTPVEVLASSLRYAAEAGDGRQTADV